MDLIEKSIDLLSRQLSFVAVRIYGTQENSGTALLVTEKDVYGILENKDLETRLIQRAREVLENRKSETKPVFSTIGELDVFFEAVLPDETLLILGAGHIASPLCQMAKTVGFRVVVIDDREDFANAQRFPLADQVIAEPFDEVLKDFPLNYHTYAVLVTRGHLHDKECLRQIIGKPLAYLGIIGSMRRLSGVFHLLEMEGYDKAMMDKVHGPIGLPIGARTPEEIAVSIISEIISVRYQGPEWSLSLKKRYREKK